MFIGCEKIIIDNNTRHISSRYLSTLSSMIETINDNENIQLRCIKIERIKFDQKQFNSSVPMFTKNHWDIRIREDKVMQFGQWIKIATLHLTRIPHENNDESPRNEPVAITNITDLSKFHDRKKNKKDDKTNDKKDDKKNDKPNDKPNDTTNDKTSDKTNDKDDVENESETIDTVPAVTYLIRKL